MKFPLPSQFPKILFSEVRKIPNTICFLDDEGFTKIPEPEVQICPNCCSDIVEDPDQYDVYKYGNPECNARWEIKKVE